MLTSADLCPQLDGDGGEVMDDDDVDFFEEAHTVPATSAPNFYNNSSLQLLRVQSSLTPQPNKV